MNDSIIVDMYVNVYIYPSASYIYIYTISISIPISTYLPTYQAFLNPHTINKKKQAPSITVSYSPLPVPLARARVYSVYIWTYGRILLPVLSCSNFAPSVRPPSPQEKKDVRFGGFAPPLMWWFITHTVTTRQGKTRQDKASYLPACKRIKKKIRTPPSDNVTMLSNPRWITIEGAGLSVCLSTWSCLSGLVLSGLSYLQYGPRTYTRTLWSFEGLSLFFYILQCLLYIPKACLVCLPGLVWSVWSA